eukprot:CAMPEP_0119407748 /NCGR_PEP_ID=MMETSP1335-20130426/1535_1 /TAXON_ID=259385 /ORGANISM="Chrysoculter rhomboideus, Strain RCC1486" /LENGTH=137 /DNA_ID=CAMNT_0007431899 /DNA_START=898 /DNA_END=1313 /DNA_ORIENTATION=+
MTRRQLALGANESKSGASRAATALGQANRPLARTRAKRESQSLARCSEAARAALLHASGAGFHASTLRPARSRIRVDHLPPVLAAAVALACSRQHGRQHERAARKGSAMTTRAQNDTSKTQASLPLHAAAITLAMGR